MNLKLDDDVRERLNDTKTDYQKVKEFTEQSLNKDLPNGPSPMCKGECLFLVKMILDEIGEYLATVMEPEEYKKELTLMVANLKDIKQTQYISHKSVEDWYYNVKQTADQADALVDIYYYMLNAACKKGIDISRVFNLVHEANMNKRDPKTGTFLKREDGKIIKPPNFKEADVNNEIRQQIKEANNNGNWPLYCCIDDEKETGISRVCNVLNIGNTGGNEEDVYMEDNRDERNMEDHRQFMEDYRQSTEVHTIIGSALQWHPSITPYEGSNSKYPLEELLKKDKENRERKKKDEKKKENDEIRIIDSSNPRPSAINTEEELRCTVVDWLEKHTGELKTL